MEYFFDKLASYRARAFALRTFFSQLLRRHYGSGGATAPGAERTFFAALVARFAGLEHLFADDGDGDGSDGGRPEFDELCVLDARGTPTCRSCLANINSDATIIADEHFARLPWYTRSSADRSRYSPRAMSSRNLLRQLSSSIGLGELTDAVFGVEAAPVDFSGNWECIKVEGEPGKVLEALKVSWMKRKTTASAVGEWECVKATGRRDIETQTLWSPNGGYNSRVAKLILDGRKQEVQTPTGELVMANAEWEDDTIVVYFQGKQGLEMRRYMREDPIGKPEMCVAWRMPTKKGMVEWVRVFREKMDGLPNDPVDTKAPIG